MVEKLKEAILKESPELSDKNREEFVSVMRGVILRHRKVCRITELTKHVQQGEILNVIIHHLSFKKSKIESV